MTPASDNMNSGAGDDRIPPDQLAAIAAVDGLGTLDLADAGMVDPREMEELEAAAGALFSAFAHERQQSVPIPSGFHRRLEEALERRSEAEGARAHGTPPGASPGTPHGASGAGRWGFYAAIAGWAAAAALLVGFLTTLNRVAELEEGSASTKVESELVRFQLTAPDIRQLAWQPLPGQPGVKGAVIWSDERNDGYMRLRGLPVNDPTESQYQLWIFRGNDPAAEPHPVDGGVFDVASSGEVIIPIDAKLQVGKAGIFAVTVEEPGGVVVSEREKIVALAQKAS